MIRIFKHYVPTPLFLIGFVEFAILFLAIYLAWSLRLALIHVHSIGLVVISPGLLLFAAVNFLTMVALGLYQSDCYRSLRLSSVRLATALMTSNILLSFFFFAFPLFLIWRSVLLYASIFAFLMLMALRAILGAAWLWSRLRRRLIVLGAGQRAQQLCPLEKAHDSPFEVARFVAMSASENAIPGALAWAEVGGLADLMAQERVDEVVVAIDERRGALPVSELLAAKMMGVRVSDLSTFLERETGRVNLDSLNPSWMIFSDGFIASRQLSVIAKRIFDILASLILLIIASPLIVLSAIFVKLTSPGPVFYQQERVGQFGNPFMVMKFRSMREDAEKDGAPRWATERDPRVTPVGRVLRATRLDEVPQIINVLKGDMSFVGPRPERPFFVNQLAKDIPYYNERHIVKPGITGWAQTNFSYGASVDDARTKLEYDLYYVKNYSLFLDIVILLQTVRVVMWQDGSR